MKIKILQDTVINDFGNEKKLKAGTLIDVRATIAEKLIFEGVAKFAGLVKTAERRRGSENTERPRAAKG